MKIIFLDVDGVINVPPYGKFSQACLKQLYRIVDKTKAKIVVSSSWRCGDVEATKQSLVLKGFSKEYAEHIVGETCRGYHFVKKGSKLPIVRGNEIKEFVDIHLKYPWIGDKKKTADYQIVGPDGEFRQMRHNVVNVDYYYVILDDDADMLLEQSKHFVHTDYMKGLTKQDADQAIKILISGNKTIKVQVTGG